MSFSLLLPRSKRREPSGSMSMIALAVVYAVVFIVMAPKSNKKNDPTASSFIVFNNSDEEHITVPSRSGSLYTFGFPHILPDFEKQEAVKQAFLHCWNNYERQCWGRDAIKPLSGSCATYIDAGLLIIDSLSTLKVMGLEKEFSKAREFVAHDMTFNGQWSMFEFTIRILGGLISAYDLSNDTAFLDKAVQAGRALLPIYDSNSGFYGGNVNFRTNHGTTTASSWGGFSNIAEVGTYQLEFIKLSQYTGDPVFIETAMKVYKFIWSHNPDNGLITSAYGGSSRSDIELGGGYDSYYEYITKTYALTNGTAKSCLDRHLMAMDQINRTMLFYTKARGLLGLGALHHGLKHPEIEHLSMFIPGMLAVGSVKDNPNCTEHMEIAEKLVDTYAEILNWTKSKIMPERTNLNIVDSDVLKEFSINCDKNILRPEAAESIYVLWKFTGKQKFREYAWNMFKGFNASARTKYGFSELEDLNSESPRKKDIMESFFLAETLKYLYLTFSDSTKLSSDEWVFNTEAHPLRMWDIPTAKKWEKFFSFDMKGKTI